MGSKIYRAYDAPEFGALLQNANKASPDLFQALVASAEDFIIMAGTDGVILDWNPAAERTFGFTAMEAIGRELDFMVPIDRRAEATQCFGRARRGERVARFETLRLRHDGSVFAAALTLSPLRATDGEVIGIAAIGRDISDQTKAACEQQRSRKMEAIALLAGGIAHDFNVLLLTMQFNAERLRAAPPDDEHRHDNVDEILRAIERGQALARQLLTFSSRQSAAPRLVDLGERIGALQSQLQRILPANCAVVRQVPQAVWPVFVDPDQIETLILHLAGNARDAMPYGGQLKISVENTVLERPSETLPAGDYVALRISDTGFGMPPQVVEHAFEPFFTTKENGLGGGLGLATCYGIVRQAGGDISLASEVGAGTTFTVLFPRGIEAVTESMPVSREIASAPGGTETILLVEDDPMVLTVTSRILTERGYRVYTAADGEQARRFILQHSQPIDLVLTDLMMPKMSGSELVERLDLSHPNLKVLYATGYRDQAIGAESLLDPDRPVLLKPYRPRDLLLKVREVLDG